MSVTYRLAHVTDPHFQSFAGARWSDFTGKRAVGALNLVVNRRRMHKMELLAALGEDLKEQEPDHLVVSGDLSNVSLVSEWQAALRWLEALGRSSADVTVIPGNHDAYVPSVVETGAFEGLFAAYQTTERDGERAGRIRHAYPFLRIRGPLALICLNSCVATGDLGAWGDIGAEQLSAARELLNAPESRAKRRVVVLHHPPVMLKGGEDRNLRDRVALSDLVAKSGAELIIHGHDHKDESATLTGPMRAVPVVGAGSASYAGANDRRARYNVYEFSDDQITLSTRAHDESTDGFREVARRRL